jgi:hypothetical protein
MPQCWSTKVMSGLPGFLGARRQLLLARRSRRGQPERIRRRRFDKSPQHHRRGPAIDIRQGRILHGLDRGQDGLIAGVFVRTFDDVACDYASDIVTRVSILLHFGGDDAREPDLPAPHGEHDDPAAVLAGIDARATGRVAHLFARPEHPLGFRQPGPCLAAGGLALLIKGIDAGVPQRLGKAPGHCLRQGGRRRVRGFLRHA